MQQRFDLYDFPHKGLRYSMQTVLVRLGQLDPSNDEDVAATLGQLEELLCFFEQHMQAEGFVHDAIREREPSHLVNTLVDEHEGHHRAIAALRADAAAFARAAAEPALAKRARTRHLYLSVSRFVAENLAHMAVEETDLNPVLWRLFDDTELVGLWGKIMSKETEAELARGVRWILPAVSLAQRTELILGARMAMPPQTFASLLPLVRSVLPENEAARLDAALA